MRISDWSSDVCSSDLAVETTGFAERLSADEHGGAASPSGGKFRLARREGTASRWFAYNPQRKSQFTEKTMPRGLLENELMTMVNLENPGVTSPEKTKRKTIGWGKR